MIIHFNKWWKYTISGYGALNMSDGVNQVILSNTGTFS